MVRKIFFTFFLSMCFTLMNAQGFKGSVVLGFNASQIDGDDLLGYDKLGLTGGFRLAYPIKKNIDLSMEMLYSQRGSQSKISFGSASESVRTSLDYFEIPVMIGIKDWYIEEGDFHKVQADLGLSYGYLFRVASLNPGAVDEISFFKKSDLSYLASATYAVNQNWSFSFRYTRSFIKILKSRTGENDGWISYFLSFRSAYNF